MPSQRNDNSAGEGKEEPRKRTRLPTYGDPNHKITDEELREAIEETDLEYFLKKTGKGEYADD
jgi:hypothetical protein